jgi:peroxiredoxin
MTLEGTKAPDFSLEGSDGLRHSLKDYTGKKTTGTIRSTVVIGPDGIVKKHWTKVAKAEQHPAEVLAFLETT